MIETPKLYCETDSAIFSRMIDGTGYSVYYFIGATVGWSIRREGVYGGESEILLEAEYRKEFHDSHSGMRPEILAILKRRFPNLKPEPEARILCAQEALASTERNIESMKREHESRMADGIAVRNRLHFILETLGVAYERRRL